MSKANAKAIVAEIKTFLEANLNITKKDFLKAVGQAFDNNKNAKTKSLKLKAAVDKSDEDGNTIDAVMKKPVKKDTLKPEEGDEKPKRKLSDYQIFAKEQLAFLKNREDSKDDGEEKLKQKDLMKLVAKRWNMKKAGIDEEEWDDRMKEEE
jgi:hypothetical protein